MVKYNSELGLFSYDKLLKKSNNNYSFTDAIIIADNVALSSKISLKKGDKFDKAEMIFGKRNGKTTGKIIFYKGTKNKIVIPNKLFGKIIEEFIRISFR